MRIIVVGCGKVGMTIISELSREGHDLIVVDKNPSVIEMATNEYDVMGLVGNGTSYNVLKEAGVLESDVVCAVTDSDEQNLLTCLFAKKAGCSTIARVRNPIYHNEIAFISEQLGLSMAINPEMEAAREIAKLLRFPAAVKIDSFANGRVELLKFSIPENTLLDGCKLADIAHKTGSDCLVCLVERGNEATIPDGSFILQAHDIITLVSTPSRARGFFNKAGVEIKRVKDTLIVGGGAIAFYLAKILDTSGIAVKIIEQNHDHASELADLLPKASIVVGDGTDQSFLIEEGIEQCESFVPLTGIDEENIFLSLYASTLPQHVKTITKIDRINFSDIISKLKLGSLIYPKHITAEHIVRYVRAMNEASCSHIETLHHLSDDKAEALEFIVLKDSELIDIPLVQLPIKKEVLIACITRKNEIIIPKGSDVIKTGDRVIVVTSLHGFNDLEDILEDSY